MNADTPVDAPKFQSWEDAVQWLIDQPDQQPLVRACYFDRPLEQAARRYRDSGEWQAVRAYLPDPAQGARALDLGAGCGIASFALAHEGYTVDAVEPDPSELVGAGAIRALAEQGALPITVHQSFGESLPFTDARFDVVVARQVLHHARDLAGLVRELHRVLKPGGTLLALRDHVITDAAQLPAFLARHPLHNLYGGEHAWRAADYRQALEQAGFRIARTFGSISSPINLEPMTPEDVGRELAARLPVAGGPVARLLTLPMLWPATAALLDRVDNRPGRLISFHCLRAR